MILIAIKDIPRSQGKPIKAGKIFECLISDVPALIESGMAREATNREAISAGFAQQKTAKMPTARPPEIRGGKVVE